MAALGTVSCTATPNQQPLWGSGSQLGYHLPPFIPESPAGYSLASLTEGPITLFYSSEKYL